jgi:hypothetical protein
MRHVCVTATSDPLKSTFRERERDASDVCADQDPQNDQNDSRCVSKSMCVISICTTHVKLGSSARLHVARSPNPRAEPTQGASTALSVWLYRSASRTTHHTLCTAHYTSTCSLFDSLSLSCRISPPSAHAPLSNTRTHTHTTHAHAETLIVPHSLLTPPSLSPLPTRRPQ